MSRGTARRADDGKRLEHTTIKVRLFPTERQSALFEQTFGCCRYLWNQMLLDEQRFYCETGEHFIPTPARYKKGAPFLKEADSGALATVHQNLRRAFRDFFAQPEHYRHPVLKKKKDGGGSYTVYCQYYTAGNGSNIYLTEDGIRLPKAGTVKANLYRRPLPWWKLKSATVSRTSTGKYFCSLLYERAVKVPQAVRPTPERTLGLSYSLSHFYVDSEGHMADPPHWLDRSREKLSRMQQKLSRMERGSKNHQEQLQKLRRLHEHIANQRKDFLHQESRRIANAWDAVCVRQSDLRELSGQLKWGNVMDGGFGRFRTYLQYKLERQGKAFLVVDGYLPVARTCHVCGLVKEDLAPEEQVWTCPGCGTELGRAVNSAQNIRDQGLAQLYGRTAATA